MVMEEATVILKAIAFTLQAAEPVQARLQKSAENSKKSLKDTTRNDLRNWMNIWNGASSKDMIYNASSKYMIYN